MLESLTTELVVSGFFSHASNEDSSDLQAEFAAGKIWSMYDERLGRFFLADAEDLAEYGIKSFLDEVESYLRKHGVTKLDVTEDGYDDGNYYNVTVNGELFKIWDAANGEESWGKASFATFNIINTLLKQAGSSERVYAYNGGNDLGFIFLTDFQHRLLMQFPEAKTNPHEMPYVMVDNGSGYGIAERPSIKRPSFIKRYVKWLPLLIIVAIAKYYLYTTHHNEMRAAPRNLPQVLNKLQVDVSNIESMYTLKLGDDFTVIRTQLADTPQSLTWVITENGNTVLERGADKELSYRYYRLQKGAAYTVHLKAFFNNSYHIVSNTISFTP